MVNVSFFLFNKHIFQFQTFIHLVGICNFDAEIFKFSIYGFTFSNKFFLSMRFQMIYVQKVVFQLMVYVNAMRILARVSYTWVQNVWSGSKSVVTFDLINISTQPC